MLFSTSVLATDVAAGLAARLDAGLNWDLIDLVERDGQLVGSRLDAAGLRCWSRWAGAPTSASPCSAAARSTPSVAAGAEPEVVAVDVEVREHSQRATIVSQSPRPAEGPSIADADVVVAGGIGLGAAEHFALAEELAAVLGGAVGATRAAVYKGWYPSAAQIGQTGKTVTPRLYVALGISGAVQHKVGMQNSKVIVAINKDLNAPIFEFSDLGVVGDVHAIVPKLVELLRERRGRDDPARDFPPPFRSSDVVAAPTRSPATGSRWASSWWAPGPPAWPAPSASDSSSRTTPRRRRAPGRRAPGRRREGQAARLAPVVGRRDRPPVAAPAVRRATVVRRHPQLRTGRQGIGLRPHPHRGLPDPVARL